MDEHPKRRVEQLWTRNVNDLRHSDPRVRYAQVRMRAAHESIQSTGSGNRRCSQFGGKPD